MVSQFWDKFTNVSWLSQNCCLSPVRKLVGLSAFKIRRRLRGGGLMVVDAEELFRSILSDLGHTAKNSIGAYTDELLNHTILKEHWEAQAKEKSFTKFRDWEHRIQYSNGNVAIYYALVRELKPDVIVETGTATGSMTSFLLAAINANEKGRVISIDIPPKAGELTMDQSLDLSEIGYWIPDALKIKWEYKIGDAKILLPRVLAEEKVDMFVHDSLHTCSHMAFEYAVARALMRHGSIIASDDVLWNNAFDDFLATHKLTGYAPFSNPNIAVVANLFNQYEQDIGTNVVSFNTDH